MKKLMFSDQELMLHPQGILIWPAQSMAVVSDLHLEKGSFFAPRHYFLPPYDTYQTLHRLSEILKGLDVGRLLLLGDSFHDEEGYMRMRGEDRHCLHGLIDQYETIWISGNHDQEFVPPGCQSYEHINIQNLIFRHEASGRTPEISGHFHPKMTIRHKGSRLSRSCFIEDGKRLIMPAFGAYTGGLDVTDPEIGRHFGDDYHVHITGKEKIYTLSSPSLSTLKA
jgi:DNA ligase-associated metallophosphoesterase